MDIYEDNFLNDDDFEEDDTEDLYLTFETDNKIYGVDISKVVEIVVLQEITEVPDMPDFIQGLINIRGRVIPVIDIRSRFDIEAIPYTERTCVIIVESKGLNVGLIVDGVKEVLHFSDEDLEPTPRIGDTLASRFAQAVSRKSDKVVIVLNLERVLSDKELELLEQSEIAV